MSEKILEIENLSTSFQTERGIMKAVDGVSFQVKKGEVLGLVGESGCGKSVTSQSILRLYDEKYTARYEGKILFDGRDLLALSEKEMRKIRGHEISMIFQDALSSLNPVFTIGNQIMEPLLIHQKLSKEEAKKQATELLRLVGIPMPEKRAEQYPHELSGGMRQRVMIAVALACRPKLLIADEPTTALDVTVQAQIMDLILSLNKKFSMGVILITHDLSVVAETCSRVAVMYLGQIVEEGNVCEIFDSPSHPYTRGLIQSIPRMTGERARRLYMIPGTVPLLNQIPSGCRFAPRCPYALERCRKQTQELLETGTKGHRVRCMRFTELEAFHREKQADGEECGI
ncbi:MAG: ABC transporter ATP-binding protein [Lachnospiraceae bacterium]|nr:ABC transporter ATP-binding protein [Lachnospiraceae bacterium]